MNLTYREDYWDSLESKAEFKRFLVTIFNLDLSRWDAMGFWDDLYRPFSFFDGDRLVSNVCLYTMEMTVEGQRCRVAQISAVATLPEYRRQGLSFSLTRKALEWAEAKHRFFFLFATEEAFRLYSKCGFRAFDEYSTRIAAPESVARSGAMKLDMQNPEHLQLVYRIASEREPASDLLGVSNPKLLLFWCLYALRDQVHYIGELDTLVLFKRENGRLTVFDIVAATMPTFAELFPYICAEGDQTIDFLFMPDKLNLGERVDRIKIESNGTHILGSFPFDGARFIFPFTAHA